MKRRPPPAIFPRSKGKKARSSTPRVICLTSILPVVVLIITCTIGMLYVGGFFGVDTSGCADYAGDFVGAFGNTDAFVGLPWGGIIALVLTVCVSRCPQGYHLPAGHGVRPQGLHRHDLPDPHSDARREPQGHDQLPWRGPHMCKI